MRARAVNEFERIAFHEAAHAVVAHVAGVGIDRIAVCARDEYPTELHTRDALPGTGCGPITAANVALIAAVEINIAVTEAGIIGEARAARDSQFVVALKGGGRADSEKELALLGLLPGNALHHRVANEAPAAAARVLTRHRAAWRALAAALLQEQYDRAHAGVLPGPAAESILSAAGCVPGCHPMLARLRATAAGWIDEVRAKLQRGELVRP